MTDNQTRYLKNLENSLTLRVTPRQWGHLMDCYRGYGYRSISEYIRQLINNDIIAKSSNKPSEPTTYEINSHN